MKVPLSKNLIILEISEYKSTLEKNRLFCLLAAKHYIKKVEAKMWELVLNDKRVNSITHSQGLKGNLDWKADIQGRNNFNELKKHVNEDLLFWIVSTKDVPPIHPRKSKIVIFAGDGTLVVGLLSSEKMTAKY